MPVRGLTPILVLLAIAPPRVCTCDHAHAEPAPLESPADDHDDGPGPCDCPDCPWVKPVQMDTAIRPTSVAPPQFVPLSCALTIPSEHGPTPDASVPAIRRTGDPPLYLANCTLRF